MKRPTVLAAVLSAALWALPMFSHADDIDLYTGGESVTGAPTNVLLILDNSSNWSRASQAWPDGGKQGKSELETLADLLSTLTGDINLGLMTFAASGSSWEGQVRFHLRPMDEATGNRERLKAILDHMAANAVSGSDPDEVSSSSDYDVMMNSAFRYFNGKARPVNVNNDGQDRKDHQDNLATGVFDPNPNPSGYNWAYDTATQSTYNKPPDVDAGCAKNFIIFIGNGFPSSVGTTGELTAAAALIGKTADTTPVVDMSPKNPIADEWARFMYTYGVPTNIDDPANPGQKIHNKITTYTIDVCNAACEPPQEVLLRSMAKVGGGKYFKSTSKSEIKNALATIFAEIQAVNSVFASATLPISVNTQGTYENQVYIGVFRPDGGGRPRWYGNLKEYQFARYCDANGNDLVDNIGASIGDERIDGNASPPSCSGDTLKLFLADRDYKPAIDQSLTTGFLDISAASFWTTDSTYWTFSPSLTGSSSDRPDGPAVEKGGAAQRLRAVWGGIATAPHPDGRKIYTCQGPCRASSGTALSTDPFVTSNTALASALASPSGTVSVSLSRSGTTVTATASSAHGFLAGDSVTITGASPAAYNGTKLVASVPSATTFTYSIVETPATSVIGANLAASGASISVTSLTLTPTTAGSVATVSVTGAFPVPFGTTSATISGAAQSYLNGTFTGTTSVGGVFSYSVTLPDSPLATQGGLTAVCGTNPPEAVTGAWAGGVFTFSGTGSGGNLTAGRCRSYSGSFVISGAPAGSPYNGVKTTTSSGTKSFTSSYPFSAAVSPDPGVGKTILPASTVNYLVDISRALGGTTATATLQAGTHALPVGGSIIISGSSDAAYNGVWTSLGGAPGSNFVNFGAFTPGPSSPATGTITAANAAVVAGGPTTPNLITWMRGKDLWEDENLDGALTDVRASVHGDVLHSRPLLINYGGSIGIVGFYGSNDGYLRSVKGGVTDADGAEKWAFIPQEFLNYTRLSRLYQNSGLIRFPNSSCASVPAPTARNYFWDGQITAYQSPNMVYYTTDPAVVTTTKPSGCDPKAVSPTCYERPEKTYIYASMRRGGRAIYALDVSVPDVPRFLWKVDNTSTGFGQLGFTWSEPKVTKIKGRAAGVDGVFGNADDVDDTRDVLVFGGGYDPTEDDQPSGCPRGDRTSYSSTSVATCPNNASSYAGIGRGVFIVDAHTGALLKYLGPSGSTARYSIPADVTLVDVDGDGTTDQIYANDSGAQLFRIDVNNSLRWTDATFTQWLHLASFGDTDRNGGTDSRKFLFPPEVVPFIYKNTNANMVLLGSGDREKPLNNRTSNGSTLNSVTCSALYPGDSYFGNRIYDKIYGFIDKTPKGTSPGSVTAATESSLQVVTTPFGSGSATAVAPFNICYGFETTCDAPSTNTIKNGWVVNLKNSVGGDASRDEEKMVSAPRVVSGLLLFGTNTPQAPDTSAGVCSNLGQARSYAIDPFSGAPSFDRNADGVIDQSDFSSVVVGGGLPPTVTAGVVNIGGSFYRFLIGAGGQGSVSASPIAGAKNPITVRGNRSRVYWYTPVDDR